MNADRYNQIMQKLSAAFPGNRYEGNIATKRTYSAKFMLANEHALERAANMAMEERDFFPSIAVLNRLVRRAEAELEHERSSPPVHRPSPAEWRKEYARERARHAAEAGDDKTSAALAVAYRKARGVVCPSCLLPHYTLENWQRPDPFPEPDPLCATCQGTGYDPEVLAGRAPVPRMMLRHLEETRRELAMAPVPGQEVSEPFGELF